MMSALKITALKIALFGLCRCMTLSGAMAGNVAISIAGMMAKYFATSLAMLKVVSEPRRDEQLLADFDDLDQLRRVRIEVHHVAGFLGGLRAGVHGHADIGLGERGRVVGAVADHRDHAAAGLLPADERELVLRFGLGQKIVHARLRGDGGGGELVVAGDHHGADAHLAELREAFLDAALDDVLEMNHAEHRPPSATTSGVPPALAIVHACDRLGSVRAARLASPPSAATLATMASTAPLRTCSPPSRSTPLMRVWAVNGRIVDVAARRAARDP